MQNKCLTSLIWVNFYVNTFFARLFSAKCPQKSLRSVISTRPVIGILFATEDGQTLIAFFKDEFDLQLDMNSVPSISTTQHETTVDAVFQRGLKRLKSHVYVSYFSYHKAIVTCLSLQRDISIFLGSTQKFHVFF